MEVNLFLNKSTPGRIAANRVMLCTRTAFILDNEREFRVSEYNKLIMRSGFAGVVKNA